MKRIPRMDVDDRFRAHVRHYHRASSRRDSGSWRQWVDGDKPKPRQTLRTVVAAAVLLAVIIGLVGLFHYGLK